MIRLIHILFFLIAIGGGAVEGVCARSRVVVGQNDDFVKVFSGKNTRYLVKKNLNLRGNVIEIGEGSTLVFRGGSFSNGTIIGNFTKTKVTKENVFHNCKIKGSWDLEYVYSSMFDANLDALILLKNLSCLSQNIKLFANRNYKIHKQNEEIEIRSIEAASKEKPRIEFLTTNPDVSGLILIGENIVLRNLIISEDYKEKNDLIYGPNNPLIGNTLSICSKSKTVHSLIIEGCEFYGGTSSSFVASSQTSNCCVKGCSFTGYMADHAVYCSSKVESYSIEDCKVENVNHTKGLFKIRSSKNLRYYGIKNVKAYNLNGYLAFLTLLETPNAELLFDNIRVKNETNNEYIFYGLCIADETSSSGEHVYNAKGIIVKDCIFECGYRGNSLIYSGSGVPARTSYIKYVNVNAVESNFGGGFTDCLTVNNSKFSNFCSHQGVAIGASIVNIDNTELSCDNSEKYDCVFLLNYYNTIRSLSLNRVTIGFNADYLFNITRGNDIRLNVKNCKIITPKHDIYKAPSSMLVDLNTEIHGLRIK